MIATDWSELLLKGPAVVVGAVLIIMGGVFGARVYRKGREDEHKDHPND